MSSNITKVLTAMQCTDLEIMFPQECDYRPKRYSFVLNEWPFLFSHPEVDYSKVAPPSDPNDDVTMYTCARAQRTSVSSQPTAYQDGCDVQWSKTYLPLRELKYQSMAIRS